MARGVVKRWKNGITSTLIEELPEEKNSRFNDVIADPEGRVFCGTMPSPEHPGSLYRLDTDGSICKILEGIGISNGLGFSTDLNHLYYTDSAKGEIYVFDYERNTGSITNQRVFARVDAVNGVPDGLTVDAEDHVWSARWDGGCLVRYTPSGEEILKIAFPARKVSSLTFGGKGYRDIFVTTAGGQDKATEGRGAGGLFRIQSSFQGRPEFRSKIKTG
jgi:D-xylonolactonase